MFEYSGVVKAILEPKTFDSGFQVHEFVVENRDEKYPQPICFQAVQEKVSIVGALTVGDKVTVSFDLRGREWQGKYFVNLNAWRINSGAAAGEGSQGSAPEPASQDGAPTLDYEPATDDDDNLPF